MEKNQIVILKDRGLISVSGKDADNFLQNIITNDIKKVSKNTVEWEYVIHIAPYPSRFHAMGGHSG